MQKIIKIAGSLLVLGALVLNTVAVVSAATNIFNDGFESGFSAWSTPVGSKWSSSTEDYEGSKSARVKGEVDDSILKKTSLSTVGYNNVAISFWYHGNNDSLDESDYVKAEYTLNGTSWITFFTIDDSNDSSPSQNDGWKQVTYNSLPDGADNNPNFGIRFKADLSSDNDQVNIDAVYVSGDQIQYKVLTVDVEGDGSVSSSPAGITCGSDCSESYVENTVVTLNPVAASGSYFTGWDGACSGVGTCSVSMSSAKSVTANFETIKTTISATKIVCNSEADLPNWGNNGPDITASTAADYVAAHPNCHFEKDWNFEWATLNTTNPGDNVLAGGSGWNVFGPTNNSGVASATIVGGDQYWVREQMKSGYVPFSGATSSLDSELSKNSAEIYCQTDVLNYDNLDYTNASTSSHTAYCVAFNALEKPVEVVKPVISFLGFRDQADGNYDNSQSIKTCGATNTTGAIAFEWQLDSGTAPMSYLYTITAGPTAVGYSANHLDTHHNGTIPTYGTYTVQVVGTDANNVASDPITCDVTYAQIPVVIDQCPNIEGDQATVPLGKHKAENGDCVLDEVVPICTEKTMNVISGTDDMVGDSMPAIVQTYIHSGWNTSLGNNWIWNVLGVTNPEVDEFAAFTKNFTIPGSPVSATLEVLADNSYTGFVNTFTNIGSTPGDEDNFSSPDSYSISAVDLINGTNQISFTVKNLMQPGGNAESNPAGLNYKLGIKYNECIIPESPVNTAPTILLTGPSSITLTVGDTYTEQGATGSDTEDGVLTPVITGGPVVTSGPGTFTLTYTVTDTGGLTATTTRTVTVNPAVITEDPKTVCNDGIDNDEDQAIDMQDPGCSSPEDNDETNIPEQPPVFACNDGIDNDNDGKIDFTGESTDPGCSSSEDNDESNNPNSGNPNNPGGVVPVAFLGGGAPIPQGRVLGASTTCGIYLEKYLRKGYKNDEESVKKVQTFLNDYFKLNIPVTGFFGPQTDAGVKKFQAKFSDEILKPWKLSGPTGIVYLTTTTKINKIMCPELDLQTPKLIPFEVNPESPKL